MTDEKDTDEKAQEKEAFENIPNPAEILAVMDAVGKIIATVTANYSIDNSMKIAMLTGTGVLHFAKEQIGEEDWEEVLDYWQEMFNVNMKFLRTGEMPPMPFGIPISGEEH